MDLRTSFRPGDYVEHPDHGRGIVMAVTAVELEIYWDRETYDEADHGMLVDEEFLKMVGKVLPPAPANSAFMIDTGTGFAVVRRPNGTTP